MSEKEQLQFEWKKNSVSGNGKVGHGCLKDYITAIAGTSWLPPEVMTQLFVSTNH